MTHYHNSKRVWLVSASLLWAMSALAQTGVWNSARNMTSSTISAIAQDKNGYIWVGTEYGLNRFDGYRYTYYLADAQDPSSLNDNCVTSLYTDHNGQLWVGTRHGLLQYDADTDRFDKISFDNERKPRVTQICADQEGELWCSTSGFGVWHVADGKATLVSQRLSGIIDKDYFEAVAVDQHNVIWIGDQRGCVSALSKKNTPEIGVEELRQQDLQLGNIVEILPHRGDSVYMVCEFGIACYDGQDFTTLTDTHDSMALTAALLKSDGQLLVGTRGQGLWRYTGNTAQPLVPVYYSIEEIDTAEANIQALFEDQCNNVWVGCYQRGLLLQRPVEAIYMSWNLSEDQRPSSSELTSVVDVFDNELLVTMQGKGLYHLVAGKNAVPYSGMADAQCVGKDRKGNYWVGTKRGICSFDPVSGNSRLVLPLQESTIRKMTTDKLGRIYMSDYGKGLLVFDPATGKAKRYDMFHPVSDDTDDHLCNDWILDLLSDSRGYVWCATASGVSCFDPRSETFCPFGWNVLHDDHLCQCIEEDADGNILIGTNEGAYLYNLRTRVLSEEPIPGLGLMSRSVCGIVAMPDHSVWMSTSRGIWMLDQTSGTLQPYAHVEGSKNHEYNPGVADKLPRGHVIFGQHDGFVLFEPKLARQQDFVPAIPVLSAFVMDNKVIKPGEMTGSEPIYEGNVTTANLFSLASDANSFVMEFSSMKFDLDYRPRLQYSIDGGRWQDAVEEANVIPFYHLPSGEYKIRVRAIYKQRCSPEASYTVKIRHPWYATTGMKVLYGLLLLAFAAICLQVWWRHKRTQVEDEKMKMLIDATHDIRTPLTLILSPLHKLTERYQNEPDTSHKLQTIEHNAQRILTLVNQILDVRRYDKGQMPYQPQPVDMVRLISDNLRGFEDEAQQRKVSLVYRHDMDSPLNVIMDRSQFEKVIVNLVANALKFTSEGGEIEVRLSQMEQQAVMRVSDTGIGIPNGEYERIFHRFYQASTPGGGEGTGIGLNLCLKVMEQHGGTIKAAPREDGRQGTVFTVTLPGIQSAPQPVRQPSRGQRVLLVDDDKEITDYIASELAGRYYFESCSNGLEALKLLLGDPSRYDVVVSDVMMPEMDGITMLRSIKTNSQISHIPVILLTSKAETANRVEGLSAGADAFMPKPFVLDELQATIDSLIANTQRHRSKFGGKLDAAKAISEKEIALPVPPTAESDSKMLERIVKIINQHLSETEFGVDELCVEIGISRSQLHRKMKDLTGIGSGEFMRNIRLEQAARMLKETNMNVSQVAYAVGFSNLGHFSKIFRTHYGVYPSEYGNNEE